MFKEERLHPLAQEIIDRELKEQTGTLILSDCGLTEIPPIIFEMEWLEELFITNGYKGEEEKPVKQAKVLTKKRMRKGPLLAANFLTEIPQEIGRLSNLKKIWIGGDKERWKIREIGMLAQLKNLVRINLWKNSIADISVLQELENLDYLNLSDNDISDLSPLQNFKKLKNLHLNNNTFSDISVFKHLNRLNTLSLENNSHIKDFTVIQNLENLEFLSLGGNQISEINFVENLHKIQTLLLQQNAISNIDMLSQLKNIKSLNLWGNMIERIEPLIQLEKLEDLSLFRNDSITDCPPEVWQTNDIRQIRAHFQGRKRDFSNVQQKIEVEPNISQNIPNLNIDSNIDNPEQVTIGNLQLDKNIFEELIDAPEIEDIKLIFVGNSGSGKTQLSKYFEAGKLDDTRATTHGIRLNRWLPAGKASVAFEKMKNKAAVNVWDFGGQEYYHGTFRLFLSNFAVYILLWESDTNINEVLLTQVREEDDIEGHEKEKEDLQHFHYKYWLDNIRHFAPDSPILIVQNKTDKDGQQRVETKWINEYHIFGDHHISLHEAAKKGNTEYSWSFDLFCNDLSKCFEKELKRKREQIRTVAWLKVRDAVVEVIRPKRKKTENPFSNYLGTGKKINIKDFEKACKEIGPDLTRDEIYTMPRWLHNSGLVIYFGDDEVLKDEVYLDPTWVTEGIYKILNETVRAENGVFSRKDFNARKGFSKDAVLALMTEMEIVFEKSDEPGTYVAPQYLPETHAIEDLYAIASRGLRQKAYFVRLPLYFYRKVLQRMIFFYGMSPSVTAKYYWKQGILFEKKGTRVMFKGILPEQNLDTSIEAEEDSGYGTFLIGAEPFGQYEDIQKEVFHIIAEILDEKELTKINQSTAPENIQQSKMEQSIGSGTFSDIHHRPVNWTNEYKTSGLPRWLKNMEVSVDGEQFVNYLALCDANRSNAVFISSQKGARLKIHDFALLLDKTPKRPLKIFFSYSHQDTAIMKELSAHFITLKRLDEIETWSDKEIRPGDNWDESIKNNMRDADIILFLLSADFVSSSYIWEKEIPAAYELLNDRDSNVSKVIPIYLRPFDYKGLPFSDQEMVPKDKNQKLKPITLWENQDEVYLEIVAAIRREIKKINA